MKVELTEKRIKAHTCPPGKAQTFLWDTALRGFGLRCATSGVKSFVVQRKVNGIERRRVIGALGEYTLTEAREEAGKALRGMREGVDPNDVKLERVRRQAEENALAITLRQVVADYCAHKRTGKRPLKERSKQDIEAHLRRNFADWADRPAREITKAMCVKRFDELSARAPAQANQAFTLLSAWLNWARAMHETDDGESPLLPVNPVKLMLKVRSYSEETPRETRIPLDHIGRAWNLLVERSDPQRYVAADVTAAHLTAFLLMTAMRLGEASTLMWSQVSLDAAVPTVHLPDPKNRRPFTLPLSAPLLAILRTRAALPQQRGNPYVFPSRNKGAEHMSDIRGVCSRLSKLCGQHIHPHALRRTFEDICAAAGIDSDAKRNLLNHASGDVHARSYANNRDPRALLPLVERAAQWVLDEAAKADGANVVELRA